MSAPLEFTDANFRDEVLEHDGLVLVDFWAGWCGPCHALAPTIDELAAQYEGSVRVGKVNVDRNPTVATKFQIRSIPSVLLFKGGEVVAAFGGVQPKKIYDEALKRLRSGEAA